MDDIPLAQIKDLNFLGPWAGIVPFAYYGMFSTPEHSGTHTDAPAAFCKGQWFVDQVWRNPIVDVTLRILNDIRMIVDSTG